MAYKIVVASGHGGEDPGAVYPGRQEKEDTLRLALEVGRLLEAGGQDVVYTRTTDVYQTPFEKAQIANREEADYFISIHRNSSIYFRIKSFYNRIYRFIIRCQGRNMSNCYS